MVKAVAAVALLAFALLCGCMSSGEGGFRQRVPREISYSECEKIGHPVRSYEECPEGELRLGNISDNVEFTCCATREALAEFMPFNRTGNFSGERQPPEGMPPGNWSGAPPFGRDGNFSRGGQPPIAPA